MVINMMPSVEANILEYNDGVKNKVKVNYNLEENSILDIFKFNNCLGMRELDMVNLNGKNSHINYHLKTIGMNPEKYDLMFYHRNTLTKSNIDVNGVSMDEGNLVFNVTNVVYKGMTKASINQNSRIVVLDDNKCQINPNLLIDEYDVEANHSAIIGKFSNEEMFYLNSRGINEGEALNLLIKGFLMKGFKRDIFDENIILNIIDKYWR
jgi:Fe-S cluster assembly scaffold protein SufB